MDRPQPTHRRFTSQGLDLHCATWGTPGHPPLLLIHGGKDHARSWDWTAAALADSWHVFAPDLRGHGDSAWSPDGHYALDALIDDLARMIDAFALDDLTIVGHSLGGNIALTYTALFPGRVRRLAVIEGLGPSPKARAERDAVPVADRWRQWLAKRRATEDRAPHRYADPAAALARMQAANPHLSPEQAWHLTEHGLRSNDDGTWSWRFDPRLNAWPVVHMTAAEIEQLWAEVTCPVLLLYGTNSWASNPAIDGRMAHFRDARLHMIDGAGHWLHHDRFDEVLAILNGFIV